MSKREAFNFVNKLISQENGRALKLNDTLIKSELDSLGYLLVLLGIEKKYCILIDVPKGEELSHIDIEVVTMKQLINRCVLSKCPT